MKKVFAAAVCALPLIFAGQGYAQGTKGPSGSGAQSAEQQSRMNEAKQGDVRSTAGGSKESAGVPDTDTATQGSADSMSSVAPAQPATPRTTGPGAGHNRSGSGDAAGTEPRARDDQGVR